MPPLPSGDPRSHLAAFAGRDGTIYAVGGKDANGNPAGDLFAYAPGGTSWSQLTPMSTARYGLAGVTGHDGLVYAIGGTDGTNPLATVEAYNPTTGQWSSRPSLNTPRFGLAAVVAPDGTIYAIGGYHSTGHPLSSIEAYNPSTDSSWHSVPSLPVARGDLGAAVGPDGDIVVIGGNDSAGDALTSVNVYNSSNGIWSAGDPLPVPDSPASAVAGADRTIYLIGSAGTLSYATRANTWSTVASLPVSEDTRALATGVDGTLYAVSDAGIPSNPLARAPEGYNPATDSWTLEASMPTARTSVAAVGGPSGPLYTFGGISGAGLSNAVEAYNPATNAWTCSTNDVTNGQPIPGCTGAALTPMPTPRQDAAAVTLNGLIYVIGGYVWSPSDGYTTIVEAYNPATNTWTCSTDDTAPVGASSCTNKSLQPLPAAAQDLAVTQTGGVIYAFGGCCTSGGAGLGLAESYDPVANNWAALPAMPTARQGLAVTAGPDGRIYTFGGTGVSGSLTFDVVEAYDPSSQTWTCSQNDAALIGCASYLLPPMLTARSTFAATTGLDGTIYLAGGVIGSTTTSAVETYRASNLLPATVPISIAPGWNLLNLPVRFTATTAATVVGNMNTTGQIGAGRITALATFSNGRFSLYMPGYSADVSLPAGQAVVVLSTRAGTWHASGIAPSAGQPVSLHPGWNLVGAAYPSWGLDGSDINNEIGAGCGLQEVATYSGGTYTVHQPSDTSYHVASTAGMWVLGTKSFTWTPM